MKTNFAIGVIVALTFLSGCSKPQKNSPAPSNSSDAVQTKLKELAGNSATDCGSPKSQEKADVEPATDCAMKAAQNKQPFYVRYDLPGMTTAMAGNSQGQLYAVQSTGSGSVEATLCPAEIRVAQSGRVTCYGAGSMGMGTTGGASPHGGMMQMPPANGPNPHEGAIPSHEKKKP